MRLPAAQAAGCAGRGGVRQKRTRTRPHAHGHAVMQMATTACMAHSSVPAEPAFMLVLGEGRPSLKRSARSGTHAVALDSGEGD